MLQHDFAELQGQIVGAIGTLKLVAGAIAMLLGALAAVCVYVFLALAKAQREQGRKVDKHDTRLTRVETRLDRAGAR